MAYKYAGAVANTFLQSLADNTYDPEGTVTVQTPLGATATIASPTAGSAPANTGPAAPNTVVAFQKIVVAGTTYWIPLMQ
jgi:hypothetical protein